MFARLLQSQRESEGLLTGGVSERSLLSKHTATPAFSFTVTKDSGGVAQGLREPRAERAGSHGQVGALHV